MEMERASECRRRKESGRYDRYDEDLKYWHPHNDPGPGYVARVERWVARQACAIYRWHRGRRNTWRSSDRDKLTSVTVPAKELFNVSSYRPGDYLQFFQDPRTRADYVRWAQLLLTAEEFHTKYGGA